MRARLDVIYEELVDTDGNSPDTGKLSHRVVIGGLCLRFLAFLRPLSSLPLWAVLSATFSLLLLKSAIFGPSAA